MFTLSKSLSNIFVNCKLIKKGACIAVCKANLGSFNINDAYKVVVCTAHFDLIYDFPKIKAKLTSRSSSTSNFYEFKRTPVSYFEIALFMSMKILLGIFKSIFAAKTGMDISKVFI